MINTAQACQNEERVGRAIQKSGIKREDIFVVEKYGFRSMQEILQQKASRGVCAN